MEKPKTTQMDVAEYLDYIDNMDDLEGERLVELYDKEERIKKYLTVVIIILAFVVAIAAVVTLT